MREIVINQVSGLYINPCDPSGKQTEREIKRKNKCMTEREREITKYQVCETLPLTEK